MESIPSPSLRPPAPRPTARRVRQALTPEEATRLFEASERGPTVGGMTGPDRARLYALALGTGFRASELATLTPERFDLTSSPPTATVPGAYTKNRKEAVQPLPPTLAARLAPWLATLPLGKPVFNMPQRRVAMIRFDLTAAGIEYETPSGVADFHSLRGAYVSNLVASGASVKVCQTLARHSSPSLTIGVYAKASLHDIGRAVDGLPDLANRSPRPKAMAATGTDGRIGKRLALHLPYAGDGDGRESSESGGLVQVDGPSDDDPGTAPEVLDLPGVGGSRRDLTGTVGGMRGVEAPGGFEPPMEVLQTSALPLGYGARI